MKATRSTHSRRPQYFFFSRCVECTLYAARSLRLFVCMFLACALSLRTLVGDAEQVISG